MQTIEAEKLRRIIIIDDNEDILKDFARVLTKTGTSTIDDLEFNIFDNSKTSLAETIAHEYDLTFATQGKDGYEMVKEADAQNKPFQLAFVDMRMPPGWDGLKTIENIWKVDRDIQVVICTAYSDHSWEELITNFGETDNLLILKKPFDIVEVAQMASALTRKWILTKRLNQKIGAIGLSCI